MEDYTKWLTWRKFAKKLGWEKRWKTVVKCANEANKMHYTQNEIAQAFKNGKFGMTSKTGNYKSDLGDDGSATLLHYNTIEAIRVKGKYGDTPLEGQIGNSECYSRGWAHCSYHGAKYSLPLTTLNNKFDIYSIKILVNDHYDYDSHQTAFCFKHPKISKTMQISYFRIEICDTCIPPNKYELYVYHKPTRYNEWGVFIKMGNKNPLGHNSRKLRDYYLANQQTDLDRTSCLWWLRSWIQKHYGLTLIQESQGSLDTEDYETQKALVIAEKINLSALSHIRENLFDEARPIANFDCEYHCEIYHRYAIDQVGRQCVNCGGFIHNRHAITEAYRLKHEHGIDSGVLCCGCYDQIAIPQELLEHGLSAGGMRR